MPPSVAEPLRPFSATDAVFAGFRLARRRPQVVLALAAVNLALLVVFGVAMVAMAGPALTQMQTLGPKPDPAVALALLGRLLPFYAVATVLVLAVYAVVYAAVNRAVLLPGAGWTGAIRAGATELRQALVLAAVWAVLFVLYVALSVVTALVLGATGAAVAAIRSPGVLVGLMLVVVLGGTLFAGVRLSLASPLTFDQGRIDLRGAWRMTRGRFWPLLGAYALAWSIMLVLGLAFMVAYAAAGLALGGGADGLAVVFRPDLTSLAAYFKPLMMIYMVGSSLLYGLGFAVLIGASADAYRQLAGTTPSPGPAIVRTDRSTHFGLHV